MTEKETIEHLRDNKKVTIQELIRTFRDEGIENFIVTRKEYVDTLLNLLEKKAQVIDRMAEQLAGLAIFDKDKDEPLILGNKEEVKQYFEKKVEEK